MHSSCTHWRTRSRTALASAGISKSMDMALPRVWVLVGRQRGSPRRDGQAPCVDARLGQARHMDLVFIHGPAAAGKLTVGKALAALTGYPLFHNHLIVDAVAAVFPFGSAAFVRLRQDFW